jgi:hypothetical protein
VGPHEVHAGSERDRRELRRPARADDAVRRLVERPVAAGGDDEAGAGARRLLGELDQVAGTLGEERLALEPELRGAVRELRPAAAGGAVARRRVDEEDGAGANGTT